MDSGASFSPRAVNPAVPFRSVILVLLALFGLPTPVTAAYGDGPYEQAMIAYEGGDYQRALANFRALADHGQARAEFMLGVLYFYGTGVTANNSLAAVWFQRSAAKGNANAQLAFGSLHIRGIGVNQDLVKAYMWLTIAAESGADGLRQQAIQLRTDAARLMHADEIDRATGLADRWRPRKDGFSLYEKTE